MCAVEKFNKKEIESLSDVFAVWMGGYPEETSEIRNFLQETHLEKLFSVTDIDNILYHHGYFTSETSRAVFAVMPTEFVVGGKKMTIFAQTLNRLNIQESRQKNSALINASFLAVKQLVTLYEDEKKKYLAENYNRLRRQNYLRNHPDAAQKAYERQKQNLSEEKKEEKKEKARLRMRKYRAEHPDITPKKTLRRLTPLEETLEKIKNRRRNKEYREKNKEKISLKNKTYRAKKMAENPEEFKEKEREYNHSEKRRQVSQNYYERHKDEISRRAKENPKTALYKQRYKRKKRLEKTGPKILNILSSIIQSRAK